MKKNKASLAEQEAMERMLHRISRIEGQLRGVRKMIEGKKSCLDVITQISAVKEAVSKLGVELLKNDFCRIDLKSAKGDKYIETLFKIK